MDRNNLNYKILVFYAIKLHPKLKSKQNDGTLLRIRFILIWIRIQPKIEKIHLIFFN